MSTIFDFSTKGKDVVSMLLNGKQCNPGLYIPLYGNKVRSMPREEDCTLAAWLDDTMTDVWTEQTLGCKAGDETWLFDEAEKMGEFEEVLVDLGCEGSATTGSGNGTKRKNKGGKSEQIKM